MYESDIPREQDDRQDEVYITGDGLEIYIGDGVLAEEPVDNREDLPDDLPLHNQAQTSEVKADVEDYKQFHETICATLEDNPDKRVTSADSTVEANEWPSREDTLPAEAQRLFTKTPIINPTEIVAYKVRHQLTGEPDHFARVEYQRVEQGPGVERTVSVIYAVNRTWPEHVAKGYPAYTGQRFVTAYTWDILADGSKQLAVNQPEDIAVDYSTELQAILEVDKSELREVTDHIRRTLEDR